MRVIKGTAGDPETLERLANIEAENERFAMLWRWVMEPRRPGPLTEVEALRLTAKAAIEDLLEARL